MYDLNTMTEYSRRLNCVLTHRTEIFLSSSSPTHCLNILLTLGVSRCPEQAAAA